jgi:hypothetical protein
MFVKLLTLISASAEGKSFLQFFIGEHFFKSSTRGKQFLLASIGSKRTDDHMDSSGQLLWL